MGLLPQKAARPRSAPALVAWSGLVLLGLSLSSACNLADGLADVGGSLGNPDASLISHPGRHLAKGWFHGLVIDGSISDGGQVLAIEKRDEGSRLAVIPYLEGEPCYVSPADDFGRVSSRVNVDLPGVIAVQRYGTAQEPGTVSFTDFGCRPLLRPIRVNSLPRIAFPSTNPRGLLIVDASQTLILIDPGQDTLTEVAENVSDFRVIEDKLWTVEEGVLKVRDRDLALLASLGEDVTEFVVTGGTELAAAYLSAGVVSMWSEATGSQVISEDGCGLIALGPSAVGYLEPCGSQSLVLYVSGSLLTIDEPFAKLSGLEGVASPLAATVSWGTSTSRTQVLYLSGGEGEWIGDVALATLDEEPQKAASKDDPPIFEFESVLLKEEVTLISGQYYEDYEYLETESGDVGSGTLLEVSRDDDGTIVALTRVAKDVVQVPGPSPYSPRGVLTDFVGHTGTLRYYYKEGDSVESRKLSGGVPRQLQTVELETGRTAFVGDSQEPGLGTLYLTSGPNPRQSDLLKISERILVDTARFLVEPHAIAYLYLQKDGSAALRTWLIDAEFEINIHPHVSEYRTVPWPAPGILYAVPNGKDQGLWYAKAR